MLLALDTVWSACSVALASAEGKALAARHVEQNRGQAETLVPMVEEVLQAAGAKPSDVTGIIVTRGPGTFAGVRVGIAFARTLALVNGARILGLSSFEAVAGFLALENKWLASLPLAVVFPAGREGVSVQKFSARKENESLPNVLKEPEIVTPESLYEWISEKRAIVAGLGVDMLPEAKGIEKIYLWPRAENLIRLAALYPENAWGEILTPLYVRPPDATPQQSPFSAVGV